MPDARSKRSRKRFSGSFRRFEGRKEPKKMGKNVLVVGSINVDYVIHTERVPKLGETLTGSDFAMNFGGKGANQAVALAKMGCRTTMLGAVGKDVTGEMAIENLKSFGVETSQILRADAPTGAAVITVCRGDNHIILDAGANAFVTPAFVESRRRLFEEADAVVLQYEIPIESVVAAAGLAHSLGKTVILNPAPVKEVPDALYPLVDYIIPNEFEAGLITGIEVVDDESAGKAIRALTARGCRNAIVTMGKRGSAYSDGGKIAYGGIFDVKAVDTTAAGDSFIGGFCNRLCGSGELFDTAEAVRFAAAVSALTVSRPGAGASIPRLEEVEEFAGSREWHR